ncbi:LON peptidase substrate-binding domain-containing protein [Colwellia sp. BRX10-3]|uniref:LON peptidase substrate-binding domain-containing protein n=1 Tax=Colwellia sp. BRX10-3 TaxID=2759844 RepID=UPI0015F74347|nr:LON peptidase substrate-binding domain-containing protein [Colwellia sp. BRX10-3]MBA6390992.1 LON peptidase substrate-binding domain-containing protein [Colwellia sp. BRX10-3]
MPINNLPIFPLPIFLLPQGVTRLRIFEARYLKMVSLAMKNRGFVVFSHDKDEKVNPMAVGSWVEIINFDQGEDGILLIDVRCKCLVDIKAITQDSDKLHHGDVTSKNHWPEVSLDKATDKLAKSLRKLFNENNELSSLYPKQYLEQGDWVVARWLELLPVKLAEKTLFVNENSFSQAKQLLQRIILSDEQK